MRVVFIPALLFMLIACNDDKSKPPEPVITFEKAIGTAESEYAAEVHQTSDGGYIVVGTQGPIFKIYVVKTDKYGNVEWERAFTGGTNHISSGVSIQETKDGCYVIAGTTKPLGSLNQQLLFLKVDIDGNQVWTKTYNPTFGGSLKVIRQYSDAGYIVLGTLADSLNESYSNLMYLNDSADTVWTRTISSMSAQDLDKSESGFIICGSSQAGINLIKTSLDGMVQWTRTYTRLQSEEGFAVIPSSNGEYIIAGGLFPPENVSEELFTIKTSSSGDTVWTKTFGGNSFDRARSVAEAIDGGYVYAGQTESFGNGRQAWLLKLDANGEPVWNRYYGGHQEENGYNIEATGDGGFIIAGSTFSFGAGQQDFYMIKTDSLGLVYPY